MKKILFVINTLVLGAWALLRIRADERVMASRYGERNEEVCGMATDKKDDAGFIFAGNSELLMESIFRPELS